MFLKNALLVTLSWVSVSKCFLSWGRKCQGKTSNLDVRWNCFLLEIRGVWSTSKLGVNSLAIDKIDRLFSAVAKVLNIYNWLVNLSSYFKEAIITVSRARKLWCICWDYQANSTVWTNSLQRIKIVSMVSIVQFKYIVCTWPHIQPISWLATTVCPCKRSRLDCRDRWKKRSDIFVIYSEMKVETFIVHTTFSIREQPILKKHFLTRSRFFNWLFWCS